MESINIVGDDSADTELRKRLKAKVFTETNEIEFRSKSKGIKQQQIELGDRQVLVAANELAKSKLGMLQPGIHNSMLTIQHIKTGERLRAQDGGRYDESELEAVVKFHMLDLTR